MTKPSKPWFTVGNVPGDRTIDQQMVGLDRLMKAVPGKTVLDCGCAQGLISIEMARAGASYVHGVEILRPFVDAAWKESGDLENVGFEQGDMNVWRPWSPKQFDIVTALAILQKLRDPCAVTSMLADTARELIVIRTPPGKDPWTLPPERGRTVPHNIGAVLCSRGWKLSEQLAGTFGEVIGYWERA